MEERGVRIVRFRNTLFAEMFRTGSVKNFRVLQGLPADAELAEVAMQPQSNTFDLIFNSAEWEGTDDEPLTIVLGSPEEGGYQA